MHTTASAALALACATGLANPCPQGDRTPEFCHNDYLFAIEACYDLDADPNLPNFVLQDCLDAATGARDTCLGCIPSFVPATGDPQTQQ